MSPESGKAGPSRRWGRFCAAGLYAARWWRCENCYSGSERRKHRRLPPPPPTSVPNNKVFLNDCPSRISHHAVPRGEEKRLCGFPIGPRPAPVKMPPMKPGSLWLEKVAAARVFTRFSHHPAPGEGSPLCAIVFFYPEACIARSGTSSCQMPASILQRTDPRFNPNPGACFRLLSRGVPGDMLPPSSNSPQVSSPIWSSGILAKRKEVRSGRPRELQRPIRLVVLFADSMCHGPETVGNAFLHCSSRGSTRSPTQNGLHCLTLFGKGRC